MEADFVASSRRCPAMPSTLNPIVMVGIPMFVRGTLRQNERVLSFSGNTRRGGPHLHRTRRGRRRSRDVASSRIARFSRRTSPTMRRVPRAREVGDHLGQQQVAQAAAFQVGAHDDRKLGLDVVGVGDRPHDAEGFLCRSGRCARRRRPSRARSRSASDAPARCAAARGARRRSAGAGPRAQALDEGPVLRLVFGPDRPQRRSTRRASRSSPPTRPDRA